jgi:hypothetical protein
MSRELTDHKLNDLNEALTITVTDEPGHGGANYQYLIHRKNETDQTETHCFIGFQNGPIKEVGVNGVSGEALIAIVIDRLRSFQHGPTQDTNSHGQYACWDNAIALTRLEDALMRQKRTHDRMARGVEGTRQK